MEECIYEYAKYVISNGHVSDLICFSVNDYFFVHANCLYCCDYIHNVTGINGQPTVVIVSTPSGIPVNGSTNTFDYPILSSVSLTCMVDPIPSGSVTYQWDTSGCYVNNRNERRCFPTGQTTQNVTEDDLLARDAGTVTCTATIDGVEYTSDSFTLCISGIYFMYNSIIVLYCKP